MSSFLTLLALAISVLTFSCHGSDVVNLSYGHREARIVHKGQAVTFCYDTGNKQLSFDQVFDQLLIHVEVPGEGENLPWYSVRGVSTDDLHSHLESLVFKALDATEMKKDHKPYEVHSTIRDLVSSCPSPLHSIDRLHCSMSFSTVGSSCVTITPQKETIINVTVEQKFNLIFVRNLIIGILLIVLANQLAKSKVFQYSSGSAIFTVAGLLILVLYLLFFVFGGKKKFSFLSGNMLLIAFLTGGYGAGLVYFIKENIRMIFLQYWEVSLGYLAVFSVLGLIMIRFMRGNDDFKHGLKVFVKWFIRLTGVVLVYNASSSPLGSLIMVSILMVSYLVYSFNKWVLMRIFSKNRYK